jgi:hypothetical protein
MAAGGHSPCRHGHVSPGPARRGSAGRGPRAISIQAAVMKRPKYVITLNLELEAMPSRIVAGHPRLTITACTGVGAAEAGPRHGDATPEDWH